jgi:hypothetical protein
MRLRENPTGDIGGDLSADICVNLRLFCRFYLR